MEPLQPDELPFAVPDDQDSSVDDESPRLHARRVLNRRSSKNARQRKKAKIQLLERREAELTEEVTKLRELASIASGPDDDLREIQDQFQQKFALCLSNPESTDLELDALVDELDAHIGVYGKARMSKLASTLQETLSMMLPMHVKLSIWISGSEASEDSGFPKWEDFVKSISLRPEQTVAFEEYQRSFEQVKGELKESFEQFKKSTGKVMRHARVLHSLIQELRKRVNPRQAAATILCQMKYYSFLVTDKVLNYGNNSSDLLNSA